jgi:ABC-type bacteriocin/lantibiotic exporter with double-glycine peptidase domain
LKENHDSIETNRVIELLQKVKLDNFSSSENLQRLVSENGKGLSGGQAQRLGIARSLYTDPLLVVLDEPTSAMDSITEKIVLNNLFAREKCTKIVIAHRLATVQRADKIIVLESGRMKSFGTYSEIYEDNRVLLDGLG